MGWCGVSEQNRRPSGETVFPSHRMSLVQWLGPHPSAKHWQAQPDHRPAREVRIVFIQLAR